MSRKNQLANGVDNPVKVGILHSLSGTMAISEPSLKDAELMAIAEINASGGVLGKTIEPIVRDGASNPTVFATQGKNLIEKEQVVTIFGCWTSATRKALIPVVEELDTLLWYPCQYEGLECSPNVFYMGSCTNQQIEPAIHWLLANQRRNFYLIGSDYVFPRTANRILKSRLRSAGGTCVAEEYVQFGEKDFRTIISLIKQTRPDIVFNTLNGDSNLAFYQQYHEAGINSEEIPIMAVSFAEEELRRLGEGIATGHYSVWSYFQSLALPSNQVFVDNYKARYGQERVTSDPIEAAYYQVYLWKAAVEKAQSFATDDVRRAAIGISYPPPFEFKNNKSAFQDKSFVDKTLEELLREGKIYKVRKPFATNPLSVSEDPSGKKRLILDVSFLNQFLWKEKIKFDDWKVFEDFIDSDAEAYLFKFDLKSGYHHVHIHKDYQKFVGFSWNFGGQKRYFLYSVLPFGLSSGPPIFTKIVRVLIKYWRAHGIRIACF